MNSKKVALVTGGSRGIGFGVAECLARDGCDLAICGVRDEVDVVDALAKLRALGAETLYCQADISDAQARARMLGEIKDRFGRLDVLVNNAGVAPKTRADILEAGEESFDWLISVNLRGPYFLTQAAAKWMIDQRRADPEFAGAILFITSVSAAVASVNRGDYCVSKAGLSMGAKLWAARLGEFGIPVYEIRPGIIRTDMTGGVIEKYDALIEDGLTIEPRWGLPEDVGKTAAAIVRGDVPYATGSVMTIDGGLTVPRL